MHHEQRPDSHPIYIVAHIQDIPVLLNDFPPHAQHGLAQLGGFFFQVPEDAELMIPVDEDQHGIGRKLA
jgi:hypothetical protein